MKKTWLILAALSACTIAFAASTLTTNWSLTKPGIGDTGWGTAINNGFDQIDKAGNTLDTSGLLKSAVVKSSHVATNGIAGSNLQADCVKSSHVADGSLLGADLSATAGITGGQLAANTVNGSNLAAGAVKSSHVATAGIAGYNLEANAIVSTNVVALSLTGGELANSSISQRHIGAAQILGSQLVANTVRGSNLEAKAVSSSHVVVNVSSTIYQEGYNVQAERLSTTDVTGATQTASAIGGATDDIVTLSGTTGITKVMVHMSANLNSTNYDSRAILYVDGVATTMASGAWLFSNLAGGDNCSATIIVTVSDAASHTFEMRYCKARRQVGTMYVDGRRLQVWALGN